MCHATERKILYILERIRNVPRPTDSRAVHTYKSLLRTVSTDTSVGGAPVYGVYVKGGLSMRLCGLYQLLTHT